MFRTELLLGSEGSTRGWRDLNLSRALDAFVCDFSRNQNSSMALTQIQTRPILMV